MKTLKPLLLLSAVCFALILQAASWPDVTTEAKPGMRWWWLGSAVDSAGLTANLEDMQHVGAGAVEITPIYGINGAEQRHIEFLSPRWMNMYKHVKSEGKRLNLNVDMNAGTGWPYGGPTVSSADAACKAIFQKYPVKGGARVELVLVPDDRKQVDVVTIAAVVAYAGDVKVDITDKVSGGNMLQWDAPAGEWTVWVVLNGKTLQKVKRAAPGGEGFVVNHYSKDAVTRYLDRFDRAFATAGAPWPNSFFNDSYEVYGADWSENLFSEFEKRRGYRLQEYIPELNRIGDPELCARVVCDYRETIGDLLLDNFTIPWTEWAHAHGATTRNQAHGSPANLIDVYAAVDIPECESFGRTRFDIPGLRVDSGMKESDSHPSVLKYSSSAAHIAGKKYTSSETFTWLTEHFRTSLSQMKPELDQMFASGVNHMYFHGATYSPRDVAWPGWLFYASVNMNINNTIYRDAKGLNDYITRTQSFLQYGQPDNDFLVYLPIYDVWQNQGGLYLLFDIHKIKQRMPAFFEMVVGIQQLGFDTDYISDKYLQKTSVNGGLLQTPGAAYKAIIVPNVQYMPVETLRKLLQLADEGATVIFADCLPNDVPGFYNLDARREQRKAELKKLPVENNFSACDVKPFGKGKIIYGKDYSLLLQATSAKAEQLPVQHGVQMLRRKNDTGYHYFVAMLQNKSIDGWVALSVNAAEAVIFNPLDGTSGKAKLRKGEGGKTEVYLQLKPGQSTIIQTLDATQPHTSAMPDYPCYKEGSPKELKGVWKFRFADGVPAISGEYEMKGNPVSWTQLPMPDASVYAGTGRYTLTFDHKEKAEEWLLNLGGLCESAQVYINGQEVGLVWSLPYIIKVGKYLKPGKNTLEVDVTNLPANRIRDYDKRGVQWRIFKDINFVSVFYKDIRFDTWAVSPSGLTSAVTLTPLSVQK